MAVTLLAATTSAAASEHFSVYLTDIPVTVSAPGLAGAEVGDIQISQDGGATFVDTGTQLTATENTKAIKAPGIYKIDKDATAGSVAITLHKNNDL